MARGAAFPAGLVLSILLAACGAGTREATTSPSPAVVRPSPTPVPTTPAPMPREPPQALTEPRVVFARGDWTEFRPLGSLWMANLDGAQEERLTPEGVRATFAGIVNGKSALLVYYIVWDSDIERSLWRLDTGTGERELVFQFSGRERRLGEASPSPDGRYVAFSHSQGIDLLDLASGERSRAATSSWDPCGVGAVADCYGYSSPSWSADGRLLLVRKGFWEGAIAVVLDPFADPPVEYTYAPSNGGPSQGVWSLYGDAFCAFGVYAAPSGLYVGEPPDWRAENMLPEYEQPPSPGRDQLWVRGCQWIGPTTIAFVTHVEELSEQGVASEGRMDVSVYSTLTGQWSTAVTADPEDYGSAWDVIAVPGGRQLIAEYQAKASPGQGFDLARPLLIDLATGDVVPLLQQGDWVVAVAPPPTP